MGRVILVRQVLAPAPAGRVKRSIFGFVDAHFIARVGAILGHEWIGGYPGKKGGLVEIEEGFERPKRFEPAVEVRSTWVAGVVGRPSLRGGRSAIGRDL